MHALDFALTMSLRFTERRLDEVELGRVRRRQNNVALPLGSPPRRRLPCGLEAVPPEMRVLPPLGCAALPVFSKRWAQCTTTLALTP
jgi:hypothetical protein